MAWAPPPKDAVEKALAFLEPWRLLTRPLFLGAERLPAHRPLLFVGNHTVYGIFDVPILFAELYRRHNIFLRTLGDHLHFQIPGWSEFLRYFGVVDGTREVASELLGERACVLVFPGGGREVAKRRGEAYRLIWKDRMGFARLAIRYGCTIVPFAAVGAEEMFDIVFDANDVYGSRIGSLVKRIPMRHEIFPPFVRGAAGVPLLPIPKPQRLYFEMCDPIIPPSVNERELDGAARALRDDVKISIEAALARLLIERERDPMRKLPVRLADAALDVAGAGLQRLAGWMGRGA